jgi:hypothetical protein
MYAEVSQMIGTANQLVTALRGGSLARASKLETLLGSQMNRANADYNSYGLTTCGS